MKQIQVFRADLNLGPLDYNSGALTTSPRHLLRQSWSQRSQLASNSDADSLHLSLFYYRNNTRPILIPLPYIRSDINVTATGKQQKPIYSVPYIYSNRTSKATTRPSHNTSPAVINFNPMNFPELSRPGTINGPPAGSKTNVLNKASNSTVFGEVPMRSSVPALFLSSPGPFKGITPNQTPALFDGKNCIYDGIYDYAGVSLEARH